MPSAQRHFPYFSGSPSRQAKTRSNTNPPHPPSSPSASSPTPTLIITLCLLNIKRLAIILTLIINTILLLGWLASKIARD
ncbi:MAG: hypothetical protein HC771_25435 [Synechococcales cyanobacterium CRU_2_2]|nr:hypothetical protein [Synechococcales cyanobacterium CRU_2_2]